MKKTIKQLLIFMFLGTVLSSCEFKNSNVVSIDNEVNENNSLTNVDTDSDVDFVDQFPTASRNDVIPEKGTYKEGVALIKHHSELDEKLLSKYNLVSATPLTNGSSWYTVELDQEADTIETITNLKKAHYFDAVDYDYFMNTTGPKEDAEKNPNYDDQVNLGISNIPHGWTHNDKAPGGSPNVVVAVIDTGVDYNHIDLRNNIWINSAEIPNNGIDDDNNGYVDDINGWNCVGDNNDPIDDNGHGTHVAGIIAAENNKEGGIGVAYNCKIMVLKAGNSSGYFNNSDIAEAIEYAYMNGASVINMSFGGSNISRAVEDALKNAYNSSILVAAAGNDSACNNLDCLTCDNKIVAYPAALPYVIGVMSVDKTGKNASSFSNYDHYPYDSVEYEVYAVGEGVGSTWPSNKYACLNGTSMAAPTVSGIAALLRSYYSDREVYSTKFIQSQIVNTGKEFPDGSHSVADVLEALTKTPTPTVSLYDYFIDDSTSISNKNNDNTIIDAGETVRLYISLHNRGGVASNVTASIDTDCGMGNTDPYFTFVNSTIELSDIGTYSVRESGDNYFEIVVSSDCPNDYTTDFNINFTYTNGMDKNDNKNYEGRGVANFTISRGYHLPSVITEDTTFTNDRLYIIGENLTIPEGVTVTFEEGCQIQVYNEETVNTPEINVYGSLIFNGSKNNRINIFLPDKYYTFVITFNNYGFLSFNYTDLENALVGYRSDIYESESLAKNSRFYQNVTSDGNILRLSSGMVLGENGGHKINEIINCYFEAFAAQLSLKTIVSKGCFYNICSISYVNFYNIGNFDGNILESYFDENGRGQSYGYFQGNVSNNLFLTKKNQKNINVYNFDFSEATSSNNYFDEQYKKYAPSVFSNFYNSSGVPAVDLYGSLEDESLLWPHVTNVEMLDKDGNSITTIGREEIKVRVTFNRPMDVNANTYLSFGTIEPYADYRIDGTYVSETVWEGTYTLKAQIENGQNFLKVNNAWVKEDEAMTVFGEYHLHEFTIDTTAAMSMNLQAMATEDGIELNFVQDDYDTLLGYNIYRSESKDGNYVKLNPTIIPENENTFLDENAEPGKTYWYTYTVVFTDFSESNPAGKVQATMLDTVAPRMYHTPVNQGYLNNNLVISCTANDNVGISEVTLYYRTIGETKWKYLTMSKQSDKYSATIFGNELTLDGIEYYIVASDGRNNINKGDAETPYTVIIKDASAISRKGDVDGDGVITTKDALMLMQCINGDLILSDDEFRRADLNGDGVLNSSEALRILQYINGKVTTLEM